MESNTLYFIVCLLVIPLYVLLAKGASKRLPPGSMGMPIIGQSLELLKAMRANKGEEWLKERVEKYGPISKLGLFGKPTVFIHGPQANKFVYTCDGNKLANHQPASIRRIIGEKNLFEMRPEDHKRVRGALMTFLKPEALKQYVGTIDEEIRMHLKKHWEGKQETVVEPLMKTLTFNVISSIIFGIEQGNRRDSLVKIFESVMEGMLSVPINLPFTPFRRSLQASAKAKSIIMELVHEKRQDLAKNIISPKKDLITSLLSIRDENDLPVLSDEEIVDNTVIVMIAGHDTTSILLTFLVRILAKDPSIYAKVLQEQEEIAKSKANEEPLTWDDLAKMKYTWRVATESLRMYPPVFCSFRQALEDIEYEGYIIPKGWQVFWAACMTQMDEKIYHDPKKFDTSRYEEGTKTPFSFVAFGGGARSCPGNELARMETLSMIHYLVTGFKWKLCCEDESFRRDPLPVFNQGLPIKLESKLSLL
ncbi:OLC1v1022005C2 [Oldenlandia corymbosa var. corymbosa]|nr:OLC1v1022005C2 [Oldenlandia corymbosa var. corymbosa]